MRIIDFCADVAAVITCVLYVCTWQSDFSCCGDNIRLYKGHLNMRAPNDDIYVSTR